MYHAVGFLRLHGVPFWEDRGLISLFECTGSWSQPVGLIRGLLCLALGLVVLLLPCAVVSLTTEELLGRTLLLQSALLMICQLLQLVSCQYFAFHLQLLSFCYTPSTVCGVE